jgi:hypothetical protein
MAGRNDTDYYKKLPLDFIAEPDPLFFHAVVAYTEDDGTGRVKSSGAQRKEFCKWKDTFLGHSGKAFRNETWHHVAAGPEAAPGRLYPILCHRAEEIRTGPDPGGPGGVHKRGFDQENRAARQEHGDREPLGGSGIGDQQGLDEQVRHFQTKPLEKTYPVIWVYALYEKIRYDGRVLTMDVLVVAGVTLEGSRDILTVEPMLRESEGTYRELVCRNWTGA